MNTLITILITIASVVALLLIIALLSKKKYTVQREIVIHAPLQKVFDYVKHIKNQDYYNKWVMVDPAMKKEFKGTDGTVGFIYSWNGNKKAGEGEQEIKTIAEGEQIVMEIRFARPFPGVADSYISTVRVQNDQTNVKWGTASKIKFPMNIMVSFIEKMLSKDLDESLLKLKGILEK